MVSSPFIGTKEFDLPKTRPPKVNSTVAYLQVHTKFKFIASNSINFVWSHQTQIHLTYTKKLSLLLMCLLWV